MGKVIMSGIVPPLVKPYGGPTLGDIAVGSAIQLSENGELVAYLVVHQGLPSSIYDESCNGTWLMRKTLSYVSGWISDNSYYTYEQDETIIKPYMENLISIFTSGTQEIIKQVKIPYVNGTGTSGSVASGTNGLSTKVFLLGGHEVGLTSSVNKNFPVDGATLSYFIIGDTTSAREKRISKLNGSATNWWLRTCFKMDDQQSWCINQEGSANTGSCPYTYGIRPSVIIPSNALFDTDTLILKGVA